MIETWLAPFIVGVIATLVARPFWLMLSGLTLELLDFLSISSDLIPSVRGTWRNEFTEPTENGDLVTSYETLKLYQIGRLVFGTGTREDNPSTKFRYWGRISRSTVIGVYSVPKRRTPVGKGVFELKVNSNENQMSGHCIWHDSDTDDIESSPILMRRAA